MTVTKPTYDELLARVAELERQHLERASAPLPSDNALREAEEQYRQVVERASDGIVIHTGQKVVFANPAFAAMSGYSPAELVGIECLKLVRPEQHEVIADRARRRFAGEEVPNDYALDLVRKDGTLFSVEVRASAVTYRNEPHQLVILRDVTERKRAEEALRVAEQLFRRVLDAAPLSIFATDGRGVFTLHEGRALREVGMKAGENVGASAFELYGRLPIREHPDRTTSGDSLIRRVLAGETIRGETELKGVIFDNQFTPLLDADGRVIGLVGVAFNITERKRAEQALRESEEKHRLLVENSHDIVYLLDMEGRFTFVSPAWTALLGHPLTEVVGQPFRHFVHPDDFERCLAFMHSVYGTRKRQEGVEYRVRHIDGSWRWHTTSAVAIRNPAGQIVGGEGIARDITKRQQAEDALKSSEAFFSSIFSQSAFAQWISDEHGTLIKLNQACRELLHITDEEVVGRYNVLKDDIVESQGFMPLVRAVFERGERVTFPLKYDTADLHQLDLRQKASVVLDVTISPVKNGDGRVTNAIIQHVDITERTRAEEGLRRSERIYRLLADNATDVIWTLDLETRRFTYLSPSVEKLRGYTAEEASAIPLDKSLTPESYAFAMSELRRGLEQEGAPGIDPDRTNTLQAEEYRKDGSTVFVEINTKFMRDQSGRAVGLIGATRDITERRRAEEALKSSEAQLSNALQIARAGHWEYDVVRDAFTFNDNFYRIFRTTAAEVGGYQMSSAEYAQRFCHPDDSVLVGKEVRAAIETTDPTYSHQLEHRIRYADGEVGHITVRFFVVKDPQGRTVRTYGVNQDITERKRLEAQVAQADRLASMGMMAAGVGHEINNPLGYLLYNVESLAQDLPKLTGAVTRCCSALRDEIGPEAFASVAGDDAALLTPTALGDVADRLKDALDGALRIKNVTRSLSTFARGENRELSGVDLMHPIESAVKMASNEIKHRARLVKEFGQLPNVWASEGKLAQVFLNLLVNAAHAIDEGHAEDNVIKIRTWAEGDAAFAEVSDTGTGISPDNLERIFEPFFTTKGAGRGSGLGLSICRNLVTSLGGDIRVESELGQGTRFVVRLPVKPRAPSAAPGPSVTGRPTAPTIRGRVLVVDDEESMRRALVRLVGRDHDVVTAASGKEGRALLEHDQAFDVILCDLMMPDITGMDLHAWLVAEHAVLARRTVFITGGAFTPKAEAYLASVGNPTVPKPFDAVALKKLLAEKVLAARSGR
jgi:two-component system, cell cycle sensor histidine kinase and response regulator CckA